MSYCQAMTGSGGWPLTIVMTPDKKPFFAGTYFPKHGLGGRAGLVELLTSLYDAWKNEHEAVVRRADELVQQLRTSLARTAADEPGAAALEQGFRELSALFDADRGGFGGAPKSSVPSNLRFRLRRFQRTREPRALAMAEQTLEAMMRGGIHD